MSEVEPPIGWIVAAIEADHYICIGWEMGQPMPNPLTHLAVVQYARLHFEKRLQETSLREQHAQCIQVADGADLCWLSLLARSSGMCDPLGAWNDYMH